MSRQLPNSPCPCGSGRKNKYCCLGKETPRPSEARICALARHAEESRVFDRIVSHATGRFGRGWFRHGCSKLLPGLAPEADEQQLLLPWLTYCHPIEGASPAAHFLEHAGHRLSQYQRETIESNVRSRLGLWEVRAVESGRGLELHDLLTREDCFVHDVRVCEAARPWHVLLAGVVDYPDVTVFGGVHPRALGPVEGLAVAQAIRRQFRMRTRPVQRARLESAEAQHDVILEWLGTVRELDTLASRPLTITNTDGDPILFCRDRFEMISGSQQELRSLLAGLEGARVHGRGGDAELIVSRASTSPAESGERTVLGRGVFVGRQLHLETNSLARADLMRRRIMEACGKRLKCLPREVQGPETALAEARAAAAPPPDHSNPMLEAILRERMRRYYEAWLDDRIPALDGRTPRDAAVDSALRPRLIALLKEMESRSTHGPGDRGHDFCDTWRVLGLDPREPGPPAPKGTSSRSTRIGTASSRRRRPPRAG